MALRIATAGGTGFIGEHLVRSWLGKNHDVLIIGRTEKSIKKRLGDKVDVITWDDLSSDILKDSAAIVNLAGANIRQKRWTAARKKILVSSRVNSAKKLAELLAELGDGAPPLLNASAYAIYEDQQEIADTLPPALDESHPINWNYSPEFAHQFCHTVEKSVEPAIAKGVKVTFLRFGLVLASDDGALPQIIQPFRYYLGGRLGSGNQPFCWITIDDAVRAINFIIDNKDKDIAGPINVVAPGCLTQYQFAKVIGKILNRPTALPLPAFMVKMMFGEISHLYLHGSHVYPKRLLDMGFKFKYPDAESALRYLLGKD